jgi:hypothetical protein
MSERIRGKLGSPHSLDTGYLTELGLLRHAPVEKQVNEFQSWPVDVFLEDCIVGGVVRSTQRRLGDHLRAADDLLEMEESIVRSLKTGTELTRKRSAILTTQNILFVIDGSDHQPTDEQSTLHVERQTRMVTANVGPFWVRGRIHLPSAGDMHNYIRGATGSFIPLTDITVSGHDQHAGQTALVNRAHLRCLLF